MNETFGSINDFVDQVKETKAEIINRIEEINDTFREDLQEFIGKCILS